MSTQEDIDVRETAEWIEALEGVVASAGPARAHYLIETLIATARQEGVNIPYSATTEYINTIAAEQQPPPSVRGKRPRIFYAAQNATQPVTITIFCSMADAIPAAYERYLENRLRAAFDLEGVPLRLRFRARR